MLPAIKSADYIIVGAGSAGCVLANRLSTDQSTSVLLLEAGGDSKGILMRMPAGFAYASKDPRYIWDYVSEPEPGMDGRRIPCPRGKVVGGSSAINAMAFIRGNRQDFRTWAERAGHSWSFENCLPYFKSIESFNGGPDEYRGGSGPLSVQAPRYSNVLYRPFLDACGQAGYDENPDVNGERFAGFGPMDQCIDRGQRASAATAFIDPIRDRPNLQILPQARARRIIFEGVRAVGVEAVVSGRLMILRCEREVILAAGAIGSPQLLMLSGVGDAHKLRKLRIKVKADIPDVGANMMDHVDVKLRQSCPVPVSETFATRWDQKLLIGLRWILLKSGRGATNHFEVNGYIRTPSAATEPNIQICFTPLLVSDAVPTRRGAHGYQISIMLMPIASRGSMELNQSGEPVLRFNYLQHQHEVQQLREGIEAVREVLRQPAMQKFRGAELAPGDSVTSAPDLDRFVRRTASSNHHVCGTCRMGIDPSSVVDPVGRVRQVDMLRVVDASIIPSITSGNINAPTMMLAEKIAATIA